MAQSPETESARQRAVRLAWEKEVELVKQGRGTRDWSVAQQAEMLETGRVSGFEGSHMFSVQQHPELAGDPNNIQFLPTAAHFDGVHDRNTRAETPDGYFDEKTGEIVSFKDGKLPAYEDRPTRVKLSSKYKEQEFTEAYDTLGQSGSARKQEFKDTRANHPEKSNKYGFGKYSKDEGNNYMAGMDSREQPKDNTYENAEGQDFIKDLDNPPEKTVTEEKEQEQSEREAEMQSYEANLDQGPASEETNGQSQDNTISY